jgi:hypothetical protein
MVHTLYLSPNSKTINDNILIYINSVASKLKSQLNITVEIRPLRAKDIANSDVMEAFQRKGINSLPALLVKGTAYIGINEIKKYYSSQLTAKVDDRNIFDDYIRSEIGGVGRLGSNIDISEGYQADNDN